MNEVCSVLGFPLTRGLRKHCFDFSMLWTALMLVHIGQLYDRCCPYISVFIGEGAREGWILIWGTGSRREEVSG